MADTRKKKRTVSVHGSIFVAFASLVILISGSILTLSLIKTYQLTYDTAKPLIENAQQQMEAELARLFDPITEKAACAYGWVTAGLVKRYDSHALMDLFLPGMIQLPQCVSMMVSDMTGYEFTIFRNGEPGAPHTPPGSSAAWVTRDFRRKDPPAHWPKSARWTTWDENGERSIDAWWENPSWTVEDVLKHRPSGTNPDDLGPDDLIYDPTARSWHTGPRERYRERTMAEIVRHPQDAIHWTEVDYFFTSKAPGLTAGIAVRDPLGEMVVIAYDLLLGDLSALTMALRPTEGGKAFVFTRSGAIIGLPHDERFQHDGRKAETVLKPVEKSGISELAAFMVHWRAHPSGETPPFRFESGHRSWWAGARPFSISPEQMLWLAVVIPESDLVGAARQERFNLLAVTLSALALSMVIAWFLSRRFAAPLSELTEQSKRIANLDLAPEIHKGSRLAEICELSTSLETMRASLESHINERRRSEEKLSLVAQEWQATFDASHDAIWILDKDHRVVRSNKTAERYFGMSIDRMIGKPCWEIVHGTKETIPDCPMVLAQKSLRREKTEQYINGRWLEIVVDPMVDHEGRFNGAVHMVSDVTSGKQAKEEISQLFQMSLDMICIADIHTATFIKVNPAFTETLGFTEEEFLGRPFLEFIHPEDVEPTAAVIEEKLRQGDKVINFVNRYRSKAGHYRWLNWVSHPVPAQGITYAVAHDITEQKEAEEALQQSEERYRSLVENTLDGYFICDIPSGGFSFLNQRICDLAGYTMEEGMSLTIWDVIDPEEHALIRQRIHARMEGRDPDFASHIYSAVRKDGTPYRAEVSTSLITYQGKPVMQGVLRDVTENEKLQNQLHQAQKMEAVGTLAGGIAHDFNNLLMGIQGRTSLLLADMDSSDPQAEHLLGIEEYIRSATELTRQLLGFARGGKYEVRPTDMNHILEQSSHMFARTRKEITVHRKFQPDLWAVEADRRQIEQVLLNIYINAWQAMPEGGEIYLQTENTVLDADYVRPHSVSSGPYVKISVTDAGIGMDDQTRRKVFDPFFTTKGMGRGTGLGMASAYGIIKNHDGIITVYSEPGEGTTFNIYLPASDKCVVQDQKKAGEIRSGTETILLVDDEQMVLDVGRWMLEKLGYTVILAMGGRDAIRVYQENMGIIDVVILDMIMPDLNGGESFDRLKEIDPDIKVLLSSGYSINGQAQSIIQRGCDGFIQKPFTLNTLSLKLRDILDGSV